MRFAGVAFVIFLLAGLPAPMALAQPHAPHASAAATGAVPSQRYATDATLREQMRAIQGNVLALEHYGHGHITSELAAQLTDEIIGHVNTIIVNCKLPPDADAALHNILGPLLRNASVLKANPGRSDALAGLHEALAQYARTFDDPAFSQRRD